jgi:hypothetical protein
MNIYYLKKFRKEAWEKYAVQKHYYGDYVVVHRFSGFCYSFHETLGMAIECLHKIRKKFILNLVEKERELRSKKVIKLNKRLAKL